MKTSIDHQLDRAEIAIEGALGHPAIMKHMAEFGYDKKRIMGGKTLLNEAKMLQSTKNQNFPGRGSAGPGDGTGSARLPPTA